MLGVATDKHPHQDELVAFGQGRLGISESERVASHLESCEVCREALLDVPDDGLMLRVRRCRNTYHRRDTARGKSTAGDFDSGAICEIPSEFVGHSRYTILERIGHGGMGEVFRARDTVMKRTVAVKILNSQLVENPDARLRFTKEVQAAASLSHPNIVTAFDAEVSGSAQYLVMEYVEGENLADFVRERGPLSVEDASDFIIQAANGLQHAHEQGMVHRDIKPHNLMLVDVESSELSAGKRDSQIRILDFGLSRFVSESEVASGKEPREHSLVSDTETRLTRHTTQMGTADYISPEQAQDARSADVRSDIYSLGCTLFFLLTGQPPYPEEDSQLTDSEDSPSKRLRKLRGDVPAGLADLIGRMTAPDPADRLSTPSEVARKLKTVSGQLPVQSNTVQNPQRARWITSALIGLTVCAIVVLKTGNGEVEITLPENSTVSIDGNSVTVEAGTNRLKISVGQHKIEIVEDGWTSHRDVVIRWRWQRVSLGDSDRPPASVDEHWVSANWNTSGFCPTSDGAHVFAGNWSSEGPALVDLGFETHRSKKVEVQTNFDTHPRVSDRHRNHHGGVALSADDRQAYLTNYYDDDVYRVDVRTGAVTREFIGMRWGQTLRLSTDQSRLVACIGQDGRAVDEDNDGLAILDTSEKGLKLLKVVKLDDEPVVAGLSLDSQNQYAFVITRPRKSQHPTLYRVGLRAPFDVRSTQVVDSELTGIAVSASLRRVFVSDAAGKKIRVFDSVDLSPVSEIPFFGQSPGALAVSGHERLLVALSPEARRLYCLAPTSGVILGEASGLDTTPADLHFSRDNQFVVVSHNTTSDRFARFRVQGLVDRIVFASNRGDASYQLYTAGTNGRDVKPLRPNLSTSRSPRWSPDGTHIAFVSTETGKPRICTIRRDGRSFRAYEKTNPPSFVTLTEATLDWSPDGKQIVFVADGHTSLRILTLTDDSEGRLLLTGKIGPGAGSYNGVSWSRAGEILLSAAHHADGDRHEIFRVDPESGRATQVTDLWEKPEYFVSPAASPDGSRLAVTKNQTKQGVDRRNLYLLGKDGETVDSLTKGGPGVVYGDARWFPSGDRLIFTLGLDLHRQLYSVSVDGTKHLRLTNGNWDDVEPDVWTLRSKAPEVISRHSLSRRNIALASLGTRATADSVVSPRSATKSIDGNAQFGWSGKNGTSGWWKAEFANVQLIDQLEILWDSHKHWFNVESSLDGESWTQIVEDAESADPGGVPVTTRHSIAPIAVKFLRINITDSSAPPTHAIKASIAEVKIFEAAVEAFPSKTTPLLNHEFKKDLQGWRVYCFKQDREDADVTPGVISWSPEHKGSAKVVVKGAPSLIDLEQETQTEIPAGSIIKFEVIKPPDTHSAWSAFIGGFSGQKVVSQEDSRKQSIICVRTDRAYPAGTTLTLHFSCWPKAATFYVGSVTFLKPRR